MSIAARRNSSALPQQERRVQYAWCRCPAAFRPPPRSGSIPRAGTQYNVVSQTPQFRLANRSTISATRRSVNPDGGAGGIGSGKSYPSVLSNIASFHRSTGPAVVSHFNATAGHRHLRQRPGHSDLGYVAVANRENLGSGRQEGHSHAGRTWSMQVARCRPCSCLL